ncbi:Imm52 family immunity protein [Archangium sp.]|uniref:Imm52 family immunity protein n=1 Tax=Archangium sp. TaxID=1872627 RepID=UPI002D3087A9|nr:Imm52 family immunity protein [Archangium sp.]HYO51826.1 Imm52 family immunity protein [Archangium sp.]
MLIRDIFDARAYWPARRESPTECARRAESFFRLLSRCDPIYARWFEQADSRKKALQLQFEPTCDTFVRFFGKKKYQVGMDLGFLFAAWTGHAQGHGGMVMLSCGSAAERSSNSCLLTLPRELPEKERVLSLPVLTEVMRALVLSWEPDNGGIVSEGYQQLRNQPVGIPHMGWLMYFSRRRGEVPPLPEPVRTESVEDKGTLIILTPGRFNGHDPAHVALADQVRGLLDRAGLLKELG